MLVTDFDDFDWVDSTSGRGRSETSPSDSDNPRDYEQPREAYPSGGAMRPRGTAHPTRPMRSQGVQRATEGGRRPVPSHNRRRQRRTIWSHLGKGIRGLFKKIATLPRPVLIGIAALAIFISLTLVVDSALYYNKVHAGVSMAGQSLSGKTYDQAIAALDQKVQELRTQPITLVRDSKTWTITPEELGQIVDPDASVNLAMQVTRKSDIFTDLARRLDLYFRGDSLSLVGEVDQEKFDALMATIAGALDVTPRNMRLSIQGDAIETVQGVPGYVVDQVELRRLLLEALFAHNTAEIQIPMMAKTPDVAADSVADAETQVGTMLSADVQLTYLAPVQTVTTAPAITSDQPPTTIAQQTDATITQQTTTTTMLKTPTGDKPFYNRTETFTPSDIKDLLDYKVEVRNGIKVLVPYLSAARMRPLFSRIEGPMTVPAVNARFDTDGATPYVVKGVQGEGLDHEGTAAALTAAALSTDARAATAQRKSIDPDLTTEDANAMGITHKLGEWTEVYDKGTPSREWNVKLATTRIIRPVVKVSGTPFVDAYGDIWGGSYTEDGNRIIAPGEEFDFAETLGPRTGEAGFLGAGGIVDGRIETDVLGGGICQVSTTLFNALLEAGLKITERWNHSIFIDHYPKGRDATITGGGEPKNLKFVNDTPNYIWLYGKSDGTTTRFVIFGTPDGRKVLLDVSPEYDVVVRSESTITVFDAKLLGDSTTVAFEGQNAFKLRLTRQIAWPSGSTTSETWISQWSIKPKIVAFPTTFTVTTVVAP